MPRQHAAFSAQEMNIPLSHSCNASPLSKSLTKFCFTECKGEKWYINNHEHWNKNEEYIYSHIEKYIQIQVAPKIEKNQEGHF